jgi:hypothetical protein
MSDIVRAFKDSLPKYIHTLPEKNKPAIWLPQKHALRYERIRTYGNDRNFLMLDYDTDSESFADHTRYDIEPNIIIYNPANYNHQAYWRLQDAVHCQQTSKHTKPYLYLRAIESAYDEKYNGDTNFSRYISRNPLYVFSDTDWRHNRGHTLGELAEVVQLNKQRVKTGNRIVTTGERGRNCMVFDDLRFWAKRQDTRNMTYETWIQRCTTQALSYNSFREPMSLNETMAIAKSVAKYTYNKQIAILNRDESFEQYVARTHTSEIQAKRGRLGGLKSRGGGRPSLGEPWKALNISRATYFRHKAKSKI